MNGDLVKDTARKRAFLEFVAPAARQAIGVKHGWLCRWAMAKAGVESAWNIENALIVKANNCLGIKAEDGNGNPFAGVGFVLMQANTGPEEGSMIHWRRFETLAECFDELVREWNDRAPFDFWREQTLADFELTYTSGLRSHLAAMRNALEETTAILAQAGMVDVKGRFV